MRGERNFLHHHSEFFISNFASLAFYGEKHQHIAAAKHRYNVTGDATDRGLQRIGARSYKANSGGREALARSLISLWVWGKSFDTVLGSRSCIFVL